MDWLKEIFSAKTGLSHIAWGLVVTAILRVWAWVEGKSYEKKKEIVFWVSGVLGVTLILVLMQRVQSQVANDSYYSQLHPAFKAELLDFRLGPFDNTQKLTPVMVHLRIFNTSQVPSVIHGWQIQIRTPQKENISGTMLTGTPTGPTLFVDAEGKTAPVTLEKTDWLEETTTRIPIESGAMRQGYINFGIPKTSEEYLRTPGLVYEISFQDVQDKTYSVTFITPLPPRN